MTLAWLAVGLLFADVDADLRAAEQRLTAFDFPGSIALLERCAGERGRRLEDNVRLYEALGIALASSGRTSEAEEAFLILATIAPEHAIRYTLSPKVTFVFERARERASLTGGPALQLIWPVSADANGPVHVALEMLQNPRDMLKRGVLVAEREGEAAQSFVVDLPPPGTRTDVVVPAPTPPATGPGILRLYLQGLDARENEIARVGSHAQPRNVALTYQPPKVWYERRWVWAVSGIALAAIIGGTVYALTHEPSRVVPVDVSVP